MREQDKVAREQAKVFRNPQIHGFSIPSLPFFSSCICFEEYLFVEGCREQKYSLYQFYNQSKSLINPICLEYRFL
jgi:hypothetical protein